MATNRRVADELLTSAVGPDLADDRFQPIDKTGAGETLAVALLDGDPVVYVAASVSRGRLQFDAVADIDIIEAHEELRGRSVPVAVDVAETLIDRIESERTRAGAGDTDLIREFWGRPRQSWHDGLAARLGLSPHRTLYQMRCPLPLGAGVAEAVATRPVNVGTDTAELVALNNRAFSRHPDQSDQRVSDVAEAFTADGFVPESVRIVDADAVPGLPDRHDRPMAGFCWTKIHPARPDRPALGEIHVIAVDPAYHGHGLGRGLTAAGLDWMAHQGVGTGMLYVESDNEAAVRTYHRLGFEVHARYTAWRAR
jgi:mycothiol synthase